VAHLSPTLRSFVVSSLLLTALQSSLILRADAHHSMSMYDTQREITIDGSVTSIEWANPHVYIRIVQVTTGKRIDWELQGESPGILRRGGWLKDSLRIGDHIVVSGYPARDVNQHGIYPTLVRLGTTTLYDFQHRLEPLERAGPAPEVGAMGVSGTWVTLLNLPVITRLEEPETDRLTPEGLQAVKSYDERTRKSEINCVPTPAPFFMVAPDIKRVTVAAGLIRIESEFAAAQREVHLDETAHAGSLPSIEGHSIGRWDGKRLVIDTANFAFHSEGNGDYLPSGPHKHLLETLTPSPDGHSLTYHFEMTDPEFFTGTISGEAQWVYQPNVTFEYDKCRLEDARHFLRK
jgi:hypothetical protein